jgi:hypothetical protein
MPRSSTSIFTINPTTVVTVALRFQPVPELRLQQLPGLQHREPGLQQGVCQLTVRPRPNSRRSICRVSTRWAIAVTGITTTKPRITSPSAVDKFIGRPSAVKLGFRLPPPGYVGRRDQLHHRLLHVQHQLQPRRQQYRNVDLADLLLGLPFDRQADTAQTLTDYIPYYGVVRAGQFPPDQQAHG